MVKRTSWLIAVGAVVLSTAAIANAATTHQFSQTSTPAVVSTAGGFPGVGSSSVTAGPIKTKGIGSGVNLTKTTVTGHPNGSTYTFKGSLTDFYAAGTMKGTFTGSVTINSDGTVTFNISGKYKGGSGKFKKVTGTATSTGKAQSVSATVASFQSKGSLKY